MWPVTHIALSEGNPDVQWLLGQQVPNDMVPDPESGRSGLVLSYLIPPDDPDYASLFSRSWIYDDAIAAVALTLERDYTAAQSILSALAGLVQADGTLGFSYNTHNAWFQQNYRSGAIAWVGYAMAFYQHETGDTQYQRTAETIATYLLTLQDPTCGSILGGPDVTWYSTEHNIDTYFFLKTLGYVSGDSAYTDAAHRIRECLLAEHWNAAEGRFNQGRGDPVDALDVNTLGALFLSSIGRRVQARRALNHIEATFPITITYPDSGQMVHGYKPYVDTETLWTEGSLQLAAAYDRLEDETGWDDIVVEMDKMRGTDGGIAYASPPTTDFPDWEAIAPTAWMAIARSAGSSHFWNALDLKEVPVSTEPPEELVPRIARSGEQVYVAWYSGNTIFLATSADGGRSWSDPLTIVGTNPAIVVDANDVLHVSYRNSGTVYYIQSTDGGQTFTPALDLGTGCSPDIVADASGDPYIVWQERCSGSSSYTPVILARPDVQATSVTTTTVSTTTTSYSEPPRVTVSPSGQNVYVIWKCPSAYGAYVRTYLARSTNYGDSFEPRYNPTHFVRHGEYSPDVVAFGEDKVYITWILDQYGNRRTNFARSENSGESFSPRLELGSSGSDRDSTIAVDALGRICAAWRQNADTDLHFRCSEDGGQSFLTAQVLVSGPAGSEQYKPDLAPWNELGATYLDAVWEDTRNGNRDIFFSSLLALDRTVHIYLPIVQQ